MNLGFHKGFTWVHIGGATPVGRDPEICSLSALFWCSWVLCLPCEGGDLLFRKMVICDGQCQRCAGGHFLKSWQSGTTFLFHEWANLFQFRNSILDAEIKQRGLLPCPWSLEFHNFKNLNAVTDVLVVFHRLRTHFHRNGAGGPDIKSPGGKTIRNKAGGTICDREPDQGRLCLDH